MSQFLRSNQSSSLGRRQWSEIQITSKVNSRVRRFLRSNHYRSQDPFWWNGRMVQFRKTLRQIQRLWSHSIANQCWNQRRRKSNLRYIFDFFIYLKFEICQKSELLCLCTLYRFEENLQWKPKICHIFRSFFFILLLYFFNFLTNLFMSIKHS